jgi:hypothetical protein
MLFEKGTNAYFLSDCFGFKYKIYLELGKKPLDDITISDLETHDIKPQKIISILKHIKTRNEPAKASSYDDSKKK